MSRIFSAIAADVRKPEEIINVVEKTIKKFGKIDILINGAGMMRVVWWDIAFYII